MKHATGIMSNKLTANLFLLWLGLSAVFPVAALQNNWTGAGGDLMWTNSANWSLGVLPDSTQDVLIDGTGTNPVVLNAYGAAANFSVGSNAVFNLVGDLTVETNATIDGTLDWSSGTFAVINRTVVSPSGTWIIRSTAPGNLRGTNVNNGTISCFVTNLSGTGPQVQITNSHLLVINTNLRLAESLSHDAGFRNTGTLLVPAGNSNLTLTTACAFGSSGTIRVETNSSLTICQGAAETLTFLSGTVFEGEGLIRLTAGVGNPAFDAASCSGNMTVNGTVELGGGTVYGSSGVISGGYTNPITIWSGPGLLRWPAGSLIYFVFATNFNVEITGVSNKFFGGACTNRGTIHWISGASLNRATYPPFPEPTTLNNQGEFILEANCTLGAPFSNAGRIVVPANRGAVNLALGGAFNNTGTLQAGTNSALGLSAGDLSFFYAGTVFDGSGVIRFLSGDNFAYLSDMVVNGTVELAGANLSSTAWPYENSKGSWTGPGVFRWSSGTLFHFLFATNFSVEITGTGAKGIYGNCTNLGTVHWASGGTINLPYGEGVFDNLGEFILETSCTMSCVFNNASLLRVPAGKGTVNLALTGYVSSRHTNSGPLLVETNSSLQLSTSRSMRLESGTAINGPGVVRLTSGGSGFYSGSDIVVNGVLEFDGPWLARWLIGGGPQPILKGNGLFRWLSGDLYQFTIGSNLTVEVVGPGTGSFGGACTNLGTIRLQAGALKAFDGGGSIWNGGTFTVDAGGTWNSAVAFTNGVGGTFRQTGGQFSAASFDNAGMMELAGGLNIGGGFTFEAGSKCKLILANSPPSTQISATGFHLDGSLTVALADGFAPTNGSVFSIFTNYFPEVGQFAETSLPRPGSTLTWRLGSDSQTLDLNLGILPALSNPVRLPDGTFQFGLSGIAGGTFEIQASTNLVGWESLTNGPFNGSVIYNDAGATNRPLRFYRGLLHE